MNTELTKQNTGITINSLDDLQRAANLVAKSGLAPRSLSSPEAIAVAMAQGMELGLLPMASLNSIAVINGRPSLYGDAQLALVRKSGLLKKFKEELVGDGDDRGFRVTVQREGMEPASETFTKTDAKRAGLWGKAGPWTQFPQRMLRLRARSFALRDSFGDVLMGMMSAEEMRDIPVEKEVRGAVVETINPFAEVPPIDGGAFAPEPEPETQTTNVETDLI